MALKGNVCLDVLTRTWTEQAAGELIQRYLKEEKSRGGDALLFLALSENGTGPADKSGPVLDEIVQKGAFFLQQKLRRTDIVARVGAGCFLVFLLGCRDRNEISGILDNIEMEWERQTGYTMVAGGVFSTQPGWTYEQLRDRAQAAMYSAVAGHKKRWILTDEEPGQMREYYIPEEIPDYVSDTGLADMELVRKVMDYYYSERADLSVEEGLKRLCQYFGCETAYVVECMTGKKGYEITAEWQAEEPAVRNHNLKLIPGLIGDRCMNLFENRGFLICNRIQELEILDPVSAERHKLRKARALMQCAIQEAGEWIGFICMVDRKEERLWSQREIMTFYMAGRVIASYILQLRFQKATRMLLDHDRLTEAWNYNRFLAEGENCLKNSSLLQAVVTMDIKNFKVINSDYSYEMGNTILVDISSIISRFIGGGECFARIEADKFVMLLEYQTIGGLQRRLDQMIRRIEKVPEEEGLDFNLSCMMGICLVEPGDCAMSVLVDHANMARKVLKDYHKSVYRFYNRKDEQRFARERELTFRMKSALEREEFIVYYQPKVELVQKRCIGFEALVRWKTGEGELIPPNDFIPLFEKNGFIEELDLYVFTRVCRLIRSWMDMGREPYPIAVNISRVHIVQPEVLERLVEITREYEVPPECLELEITESAFLHNPEVILDVARQIKERGFILSMDDFGTGYSSLCLLKDLPVDIIKLDREFFQKLLNEREKIIVSNVIHMARELDIQVISEGIETVEHERFLKEIGCNLAQGYRYGRPAPIEDYEYLLAPVGQKG